MGNRTLHGLEAVTTSMLSALSVVVSDTMDLSDRLAPNDACVPRKTPRAAPATYGKDTAHCTSCTRQFKSSLLSGASACTSLPCYTGTCSSRAACLPARNFQAPVPAQRTPAAAAAISRPHSMDEDVFRFGTNCASAPLSLRAIHVLRGCGFSGRVCVSVLRTKARMGSCVNVNVALLR